MIQYARSLRTMKSKQPFFSIVIPTLNEQYYLPKLLRSISRQSYTNYDVIVVDGQSDDKTQGIVKSWKSKLPSLSLKIAEKRGPGVQRNVGAKLSSGEYLIFFDADVTLPVEFLEAIHLAIIKKRSPFLTTWLEPDSKNSADKTIIMTFNMLLELLNLTEKPAIVGFNIIIKRNLFTKLKGFNERILMSEDYDLAIRAKKLGYELFILKDPKLIMSLRRFRTEGTIQIIRKFTKANLHFLLNGPITTQIVEYAMGGHVHRKKIKKKTLIIQSLTYLKELQKLQKKLTNLISA